MSDVALATPHAAGDNSVRDMALATSAAMLMLLAPTGLAAVLDDRTLAGANLWLKPMHFQFALTRHFGSLALFTPMLSQSWRRSGWLKGTMLGAGMATFAEMGWLLVQAARGTASHFNTNMLAEQGVYMAMGLAALGIVAGAVVMGYAVARSAAGAPTSQTRRGVVWGLIGGGIATAIVASYMSAGHSHLAGGPQTDAFGAPFLGWATRGGDLRVAHFFATHAMQALPLLGLLADRIGQSRARGLTPALAALYFAGDAALFVEALSGRPFLAL